jgi:hypothetical protein
VFYRFLALIWAVSASVACAQASKVRTDFVPTIPVVRIDVKDGKNPGKSKEREATLDLQGKRYQARINVRGGSSALYPKKQFTLNSPSSPSTKHGRGKWGARRNSSWTVPNGSTPTSKTSASSKMAS